MKKTLAGYYNLKLDRFYAWCASKLKGYKALCGLCAQGFALRTSFMKRAVFFFFAPFLCTCNAYTKCDPEAKVLSYIP